VSGPVAREIDRVTSQWGARVRDPADVGWRCWDPRVAGRSTPGRERDVFQQVVSGLLNKQIAAELNITEFTVKFHRGHIMRKMRADSVADLVRMAETLGVDRPSTGKSSTNV
jgi:DNA-binding NarL/FixJ family response regulator